MNSLISYASSDDEGEEAQPEEVVESQAPTAPPPPTSAESSPYSTVRSTLRNLTMPTTPNFSIPASPPPPPTNSESSATLAAQTKKFERFLDLKRQGVHFNARLEGSSALENPALLDKLMAFAGMEREDAYASSLSEGLGVDGVLQWPEECDAAALVKANERREKKQKRPVEFVAETAKKSRFDR